ARRSVPQALLDDAREGLGLEARAADEHAVDVGLGHERSGVLGLHAAAVLDANRVGRGVPDDLREHAANGAGDFLRLLGGGRATGADGPDRLVRDDAFRRQALPGGRGDLLERTLDLTRDDVAPRAGVALGEALAHAHDRLQPGRERRGGLARHAVVRLAE